MVGDSRQLEALELESMPINNTQDEQSLAHEASMISNELQYELLSAGQGEQQRQSSHTSRWYSISRLPKSKRFYTTTILVLMISASALILVGHYTKHREEHITYDEYVENVGSPEKLGYFNVYIRGSTDDDTEQVRLPAALFNRHQFPLDGPFTSFKPGTPVFIHQDTQQTAIFLSNRHIYLFPKLYDRDEQILSLGELIALGSAGFDDESFGMPVNIDLKNFFHSEPLDESDTPKFDPEIGGFTDGIYTNYRPLLVQKMAEVPAYDRYPSYEQRDGYSSYKTRNPYYRKPSSKKEHSSTTKPRRVKTTTAETSMTLKVLLPEQEYKNKQKNKDCKQLILATWNIGLEEQEATERTSSIINAILNSDANIIGLQEVWGGPQILRTIYQAVKGKYPNFAVVDDNMRNYISATQVPNRVYPAACSASAVLNFEICFFQNCSAYTGIPQFVCAETQCSTQFAALYINPVCWACIFDRYLSRKDPLGLNYCGAVNLPQYYRTSPGITPNSTDAPWNNTVGLMILSDAKHPLQKVKGSVFSEFYALIRGYIIVTTNDGELIIGNTHVATVNNPLPYPAPHTFFNNNYGSWDAENLGQAAELESYIWNLLQNNHGDDKSAVMLGDFNMGIANFPHNVADIAPGTWYYLHGLTDSHGKPRWYDDYTEKQSLCTGCSDNLVVPYPVQYIFDHIFTHGCLFSSSLFTRRIFDDYVKIVYNNTNITTSLSDHYGVEMIVIY